MIAEWREVARFEAAAAEGWPALETVQGPWTFRFADGYTKRANSVYPLGSPWPTDGSAQVDAAQAAYRARGLATTFKIPDHPAWAPLDQALGARGYRSIDPSRVLVLALDGLSCSDHPGVVVEPGFTPGWLQGFLAANAVAPGHTQAAKTMARAVKTPLVASVSGGRDQAWAYTAVLGDQAWLFDLVVAPEARGRGWGRALVTTLAHRAFQAGVRTLCLQVLASNAVANALYHSLGFVEAYRYHYRQLPLEGAQGRA